MADLPACTKTGKISYATKRIPREKRIWRKRKNQDVEVMEVYKCDVCPYFHVTKGRKKKSLRRL